MNTNTVLTGFLIGSAAARSAGASQAESSRAGAIAAMFPNPLAGVLVGRAMVRSKDKPVPVPAPPPPPAASQGKNPTP
jgi:H+/Cl- antiporter ClcA